MAINVVLSVGSASSMSRNLRSVGYLLLEKKCFATDRRGHMLFGV